MSQRGTNASLAKHVLTHQIKDVKDRLGLFIVYFEGCFHGKGGFGMAILKIARMGHPVLMGKAAPVMDPTSAPTQQLVSDMVETMLDAPGIGLAAPQVHVPARVVVFRVPEERAGSENGVPLTVLINP